MCHCGAGYGEESGAAQVSQDDEIRELREKVLTLTLALKKAAESFRAIHVTHGPRWQGNWRECVEKDENDCLVAIGLEPKQPIRSLRDNHPPERTLREAYELGKKVRTFFNAGDKEDQHD